MPDYDPKNIPTLDDIIEEDIANKADLDETEAVEQAGVEQGEVEQTEEETVDAFYTEPIDESADESKDTLGDTPADIATDIPSEVENKESLHYPTTPHISVQIAYEEVYDKSSNFSDTEETETSTTEDDTSSDDSTRLSIEPIEMEAVVEDVVKQLLPDMEQQLRFLIQQALEQRLPEAIIKSADRRENIELDSNADTPIEPETEIENA